MSYVFSSAELAEIQLKLDAANAGTGSYGSVYAQIFTSISTSDLSGPKAGVDTAAWSWVKGALQVNQGVGSFSEFIRSYSAEQYEIRFGEQSSPPLSMQAVSNEVCIKVAQDILAGSVLPSLHEIGLHDANAVISSYFHGDSAGWSGNPLFAFLGDGSFYHSTILEDPTDSYDWAAFISSSSTALSSVTNYDDLVSRFQEMLIDSGLAGFSNLGLVLDLMMDSDEHLNDLYGVSGLDLLTYSFSLGTKQGDDLIYGDWDANFINGGGGNDIIVGDIDRDLLDGSTGNDLLIGGTEGDRVFGGGGADLLVGGNADETTIATSIQSADYFKTYHADWDDGVRDYLSGGAGHDTFLSAGAVSTGPVHFPYDLKFRSHAEFADAMDVVDFIDGSDQDFTVHFQTYDGWGVEHAAISASAIHAAKAVLEGPDATLAALGQITRYDPSGEVDSIETMYGARVFHQTYGSLLAIVYNYNAYNGRIVGFVDNLMSERDPTSTDPWTIYGNGTSGSGNEDIAPQLQNTALTAISDDDEIVAGAGADRVFALSGNDIIVAAQFGGGEDTFNGGAGVDTIDYSASIEDLDISLLYDIAIGLDIETDQLSNLENAVGGSGDDTISGSFYANVLTGGAGADTLTGYWDDDELKGGTGDDTYVYYMGDGADLIEDWGDSSSTDIIELEDISSDTVIISRGDSDFWDLELGFSDGGSLTIQGGFIASGTVIEEVRFAGGDVWTAANIRSMYLDKQATYGNDFIHGFVDTADTIVGRGGNDELYGYSGDDTLNGNDGNDVLFGNEGADTLTGEAGDDFMIGGAGADVLKFGSTSEGTDWIDDFVVGQDKIDLSSIAAFDDFADVLAVAAEWGGTTWLNFDQNNSIRLQNITLTSLTADDFILA